MAKTKLVSDKAARAPAASEAQVHLEMDKASFDVLTYLVDALEASSISEVIRRAIQAHEAVDPDFDEPLSSVEDAPAEHHIKSIKTLHVRIPAKTKMRLDREKERIRGTYSDVIARSIMILNQIVHDRAANLNGDDDGKDNNSSAVSDGHPSDGNSPRRPVVRDRKSEVRRVARLVSS